MSSTESKPSDSDLNGKSSTSGESKKSRTGQWIALGLVLGVLTGLLFGEYCSPLKILGQAYVGLLQMTVLPYLTISLVAKLGRLDMQQARKLGVTSLVVLLIFWVIGIVLIVAVSVVLPPIEGASFFSPPAPESQNGNGDVLSRFIPTNVFRSLSDEYVPAVVVFCLFFGAALILVPNKKPLLGLLDVCAASIGRINGFLIRLAPLGLYLLTAAAAGTLRIDELARLQAYLIVLGLACVVAALVALPLLVSSLTDIRYREVMRSAHEPLLTAIATGKLFVVLPQIVDKCEKLLESRKGDELEQSTPSVVVPLAYPFPHLGKILSFVFISFAAWYVGRSLNPLETTKMASVGAISSFASPLITIPYLLDEYELPQDLMPLFILPGFITMRVADVVGVMHLIALTVIVTVSLERRLRISWGRLFASVGVVVLCLAGGGVASRWYLASTTVKYDLDSRLMSLQVPSPYEDVVVYSSRQDVPQREPFTGSVLDRIKSEKALRVGYHPDHLPYSFFNDRGELVGFDVELMHRLAERLKFRMEFVPYSYTSLDEQLGAREIDLVIGGIMVKPERLLLASFTQHYQTATIAVVTHDHRRDQFGVWDDPESNEKLRLAVVVEDLVIPVRRQMPRAEIVVIGSYREFFDGTRNDLDGIFMAAEEAAAWNVLYPEFHVVVPKPTVQRPVAMALRQDDPAWLDFLNRWLEFERLDGSLNRLQKYWVEGGGTKERAPRWCILRDVLHWLP